jgi:ParB family chromosome partitioning protein
LQDQLSEKIGVPVMVQHSAKGKGKLILKYNNLDELDGILNHIK